MDYKLLIIVYLMICILPVMPSSYRTKSRSKVSVPTYDQKQTGDYNIQLHLKDFEVVALLSDGILGDFGDYDYNYDYSDITMKPTSTKKPSSTTTETSTTSSTNEHAYSSTNQQAYSSTTPASTTTLKSTQTTKAHTTEVKTTQNSLMSTDNSTTVQTVSIPRLEIESEQNNTNNNIKQSSNINDISEKPVENVNKEQTNHEEVLPFTVHRKCANGFTRDKQGRCRRVRRPPPQFSFGISRLATLASKLRHTNGSHSSGESTK